MIKSKFVTAFKKFSESKPKARLYGSYILIELIDKSDLHTSKGGIVLAETEHARSDYKFLQNTIGIVLEVGQGYRDDEGKEIPLDVEVGNVVHIPGTAVSVYSTLPELKYGMPGKTFGLIQENAIIKKWDSLEDLNEDRNNLTSLVDSIEQA